MPATATRPASARQISFLTSLVAERRLTLQGDLYVEAARAIREGEGTPIATDLIDRVMAVPRSTGAAAPAAQSGATDVPTPNPAHRAGRMLAAGSIEATATLADGRHVTVSIRTRTRSGRGWTNAPLGQDGAQTTVRILDARVGWINLHGSQFRLSLRSRRPEYRDAVEAVLAHAAGLPLPASVVRVQESSRCGRCFRTLTDPVSIDRGIGPECYGRDTGSRHVAAGDSGRPSGRPSGRGRRSRRLAAERAYDAAFAAREREQETAAFMSDPDYGVAIAEQQRDLADLVAEQRVSFPATTAASLTALAAVAASPVLAGDAQRARDLIAEALDAYLDGTSGGRADKDFALRIFDQLAAR